MLNTDTTKQQDRKAPSGKKTPKQIAAIVCVILLVALYVATLVVAILDFPGADRLFQACLVATIGLPILLWICIWSIGRLKERRGEADSLTRSFGSSEDRSE